MYTETPTICNTVLTTRVASVIVTFVPTDEITTKQAMELLGFAHRSSIHRLVQAGRLAPCATLFGNPLFNRADVEALREARKADAS